MLLPAAELAEMHDTQLGRFDLLCAITRATKTTDEVGGQSVVWATVTSNVPCALAKSQQVRRQGMEEAVADVFHSEAPWVVTLPGGTDVRRTDRLVISGHTYEVQEPYAPESHETARVVLCAEVT